MNPTNSNINTNGSIDKAERVVQKNLDRFETAIEQLADKVEGTAQKIHHVRDVAMDGKEKLMHLKEEVQASIDPLKPALNQLGGQIAPLVGTVKSWPRQYVWLGLGVLGFVAWKYFKGGSTYSPSSRSFSGTGYIGQSSSTFNY